MQDPSDPELLTPGERLAEVGLILATGYLRQCGARGPAPAAPPALGAPVGLQDSSRSPENELDAPGDQSVHVRRAEGA